jgi:phosphomannomutase
MSTSRVVEDIATRFGCPCYRSAVGEANVADRMLEVGAVIGGEGNGGVIDPRVGFVRDSFVAMAMVLDLLAATGEPLSRLVAELPRFAMVKDQYPLQGPPRDGGIAALWDRITAAYPEAVVDRRDGLRLDWDDRWVHVRASNTEPIVRVIAEAAEEAEARALADQIGRWVTAGEG